MQIIFEGRNLSLFCTFMKQSIGIYLFIYFKVGVSPISGKTLIDYFI